MRLLLTALVVGISFVAKSDFENYFEIKLNDSVIFHSLQADTQLVQLPFESLADTDLIYFNYFECGKATHNDYELHLTVANSKIDLEFISEEPSFVLNMAWLTQFRHKLVSIHLHQTRYLNNGSEKKVLKIADFIIS